MPATPQHRSVRPLLLAALVTAAPTAATLAQNQPTQPPTTVVRPGRPGDPERRFVNRPDPSQRPAGAPSAPARRPVEQPAAEPPSPAGADQPGALPDPQPLDAGLPGAQDEIQLAAFSEPVELSALVDYVAKALNINIVVKGGLQGTVVFNAPVAIKRGQLLKLLDALLEQQQYTITRDNVGFYIVHPTADVAFNLQADELPTTRIIPTPNMRPSALKPAVDAMFFGAGAGAAPAPIPGQGGIATSKGIAYIDEMGVIVVTETPRRLVAIQSFVQSLLEEYNRVEYTRLDLRYVASSVAKARALELIGQSSGAGGPGGINPQTGQVDPGYQPGLGGSRTGLNNLAERLTIDPLGNALIFRGLPHELDQVKKIVSIIDAPSSLKPKSHEVGSAAKLIADIARDRGLGQVTLIAAPQDFNPNNPYAGIVWGNDGSQQPQPNKTNLSSGGPVMVVDEQRGSIIYYGTDEQQEQLSALISQLKIEDERITIQAYKLRHSDSTKVAELILGLIQNTTPVGTGDLLPEGEGGGNVNRPFNAFGGTGFNQNRRSGSRFRPSNTGAEDGGFTLSEDERIFVLADKGNNQVLVKAPARDQKDFERLIRKLDQRRPQVYVEAKIVAVTADDRLRLAFEQQLINANGTGGVLNSNFGLGSFATGQGLLNPKTVNPGLSGLTAAIIKSDMVPIVMRALANETDSRVISNPQLLVDDNEEAEVVSLDSTPTTQISRGTGGSGDVISQGEDAEAGTTLKVKPQISEGGYLRLKYEVELSSFTGEGQTVGGTVLSPPKQKNNVKSESITVPSDSTVVVGGLVVDANTKTIAKIPLLGDIPLFGLLFQDRNTGDRKTVLYVFLTPKIVRDPNFEDLRLLTRGPLAASGLPAEFPALKPSYIDILEPTAASRSLSGPPAPPPVDLPALAPSTMDIQPPAPALNPPPATPAQTPAPAPAVQPVPIPVPPEDEDQDRQR